MSNKKRHRKQKKDRAREIASWRAKGMTYPKIARKLGITLQAVERHVAKPEYPRMLWQEHQRLTRRAIEYQTRAIVRKLIS